MDREALKIEILNPKALQLIKGMQDLNLLKLSDSPASTLKAYLKKMRRHPSTVPTLDEITKIVEEVRAKRYEKNKPLMHLSENQPLANTLHTNYVSR